MQDELEETREWMREMGLPGATSVSELRKSAMM
jgi:hypothetical protein